MNPIEAYNLLVTATATIHADRTTHHKIEEALTVIKNCIPKPEDPIHKKPEAGPTSVDNASKSAVR